MRGEEIGDPRGALLDHQEARRVTGEIEPGEHVHFGALDIQDQQVDRGDLVVVEDMRQLARRHLQQLPPPPGVLFAGGEMGVDLLLGRLRPAR